MKEEKWPIGFAMSMAMNEEAMQRFGTMTEGEKKQIVDKSRQVESKSEMETLVNEITKEHFN